MMYYVTSLYETWRTLAAEKASRVDQEQPLGLCSARAYFREGRALDGPNDLSRFMTCRSLMKIIIYKTYPSI